MNKRKILLISLAVIILVIFIGIYFTQKPSKKEQAIKIGAILPLTGPAASFGEVAKIGLEMGVENAKKHGIAIDLIYEDSKANPQEAINAFRKLITKDKVLAVITTVYSVGMVLKPEAESNKVPLLATVVAPQFPQGTKYVVRHAPLISDDVDLFLETVNELMGENPKLRIALVYQADDYGVTFRDLL